MRHEFIITCIPNCKFQLLSPNINIFHLKIDTYARSKRTIRLLTKCNSKHSFAHMCVTLTNSGRKLFKVVRSEAQKETTFTNTRISNHQQLEQVIKFLLTCWWWIHLNFTLFLEHCHQNTKPTNPKNHHHLNCTIYQSKLNKLLLFLAQK